MTQFPPKLQPGRASAATTAVDIAIILALIACVVAVSAHAPSTTIAYAQLQQIGAVVGTIQGGNWLLPRDHMERLSRKGLLYAWIGAPIHMLTNVYNDFTFRLPNILASLATGVLVYLLGRRWYGRATGLLAACLWATIHHMAKLMYVALADMLVTAFITASIYCADRILFHRGSRSGRIGWVIALWVTMILGGLSKGRGLLNVALVGLTLAMATALWPGFGAVALAGGVGGKALVAARLVARRWWRAIKATKFLLGMLATAAVMVGVWYAMLAQGGEEFQRAMDYEVWARITGRGPRTPHAKSMPAILTMLYYMLPVTVFAIGAMVLAGPRRWLSRKSPLLLPLCWIVSVVLPFSLTHSARHDYFLPCYAGGALMGAWAIQEISRRVSAGLTGRVASGVRHSFAAAAIVISALLVLAPAALLFSQYMPKLVTNNLKPPPIIEPETWWILAMLIPAGVAGIVVAVRSSLGWRIWRVAAVVIIGMLGVMFIERHVISRQARTGDGERLLRFAVAARPIVGSDKLAKFRASKLGTELYLGRLAIRIADLPTGSPKPTDPDQRQRLARRRARAALVRLQASGAPWLVTCDKGLVELGAAEIHPDGSYRMKVAGQRFSFATRPDLLGRVELATAPIVSQRWGRTYLIRVDPSKLAEAIDEGLFNRAKALTWEPGRQRRR